MYSIKELVEMSGVSARTLRYYEEIGFFRPNRSNENNYRIYGEKEVDILQDILFFRELGFSLKEITKILQSDNYDRTSIMKDHLTRLREKKEKIDMLIDNVEKTILATKGEYIMGDKEKFEGFKRKLVEENELKYGEEIREKYGYEKIDESNAKVMNLSDCEYVKVEKLAKEINEGLKEAFEIGEPSSELAQKVCELHKEWLGYFWSFYSKEAHLSLAEAYVSDPRFKKYYDDIAVGCAEFLRDALVIYCGN